jgi:hypothetical protein
MPQATKTVTMLLGLVSLNAGLVLWSVVDHHALADPQQSSAPASDPSSHQQLLDSVPHPTPDQLPTADPPENLQADAGFQQFLQQAAEVLPELTNSDLLRSSSTVEETKPTVATGQPSSGLQRTRPAYESIEARLELVSQLNQASLGLTREARRSASAGDLPRAEKLMTDVTYLRKLAADLLLDR